MEPPPRTRVGRPPFPCRRCQASPHRSSGAGSGGQRESGTGGGKPGRCGPPGPCAAATGARGRRGNGTGRDAAPRSRRCTKRPLSPSRTRVGGSLPGSAEKLRRCRSVPRRSFGAAVVLLPFGEGPRPGPPGEGTVRSAEPTGEAERGRDRWCPGWCGRQRGRARRGRRGRRRPGPGGRVIPEPGYGGNGTGSAHARCGPAGRRGSVGRCGESAGGSYRVRAGGRSVNLATGCFAGTIFPFGTVSRGAVHRRDGNREGC